MVQNCGEGVRIKKISHNLAIVCSIDMDNYSAFLHYYCTALWFCTSEKIAKNRKNNTFSAMLLNKKIDILNFFYKYHTCIIYCFQFNSLSSVCWTVSQIRKLFVYCRRVVSVLFRSVWLSALEMTD